MARIVIELTNRCNLSCQHCFDERHAATGDLPFSIVEKVLREGKGCGIDRVSFTGGEPTIHPQFESIVRKFCGAEYRFSFVSNAVNFPRVYSLLLDQGALFEGVTFSLDGSAEATHDRLRGRGSYRRVMQAATICMRKGIRFTFNMVLTAQNQCEVAAMVDLAARLGSGGVRFGHLMPTPETARHGLDLNPGQRREVESEIWRLRDSAAVPVGMAPGYHSESPFFPCGPLELEEYNLDYRGNLTLCCQLSGYSGSSPGSDLMGNLHEVSLAEAVNRFGARVAQYLQDKRDRVDRGEWSELDHFPCWYCVKYLGKAQPLRDFPGHAWAHDLNGTPRKIDAQSTSKGRAAS